MRILGVVSSSSREVPNAPTNGTATDVGTGRAYNNGAATVTFTAPTFDGGLPITGYTVTSSPGGFTGTGSASPITVAGLQSGVAYTFTVVATNSRGNSTASAASNSITATTVPQAPTASAADVGTARAFNNGAATVTVSGGATGGKAISSYTATSSPGSFTSTSGSPLTVTGLASNTAYTFSVTATNANGTSTATVTNSITATTVPQAPTIGTATSPSSGTASITFTGNATGGKTVSTYTATSSPGSITGSSATSPITVSGLTNGTAYTFTVTATNANGTSAASAASNSVTPVSVYWIEWASWSNNGINNLARKNPTGNSIFMPAGNSATVTRWFDVDYTGAITNQKNITMGSTNEFTQTDGIMDNSGFRIFFGQGRINPSDFYGLAWTTVDTSNTTRFRRKASSSWNIVNVGPRCSVSPNGGSIIAVGGSIENASTAYPYMMVGMISNDYSVDFDYLRYFGDPGGFILATTSGSDGRPFLGGANGGFFITREAIVLYLDTSANFIWARHITNMALFNAVSAVASYSSLDPYVAGGCVNSTTFGISAFNSSGTNQWNRTISSITMSGNDTCSATMDSAGNSYFALRDQNVTDKTYLLKFNSSGTLQWQRLISIGNLNRISTDGTNLFIITGGVGNTNLLRYPCDGSVTGTYSYRSTTLTISASSLTVSNATFTINNKTFSGTDLMSALPVAGGTAPTLSTPTVTIQQKVGL